MQARILLATALSSILLAACSSSSNSPRAVPAPPARNDDGSLVTGVITARFDPSTGVVPFPTDLLLSGTRDLTLNIPTAATSTGDPTVALNTLDGWSTVAPGRFQTSVSARADSIVAGASVRMFQVTTNPATRAVTGVVSELTNQQFAVVKSTSDTTGTTIGVVPLQPLSQLTSYMVVVTDDVKDANGNDATPDSAYFLAKRTAPLINPVSQTGRSTCTAQATSTDPLLPITTACSLEPLRQLVNTQEAAAIARGIPRDDIVLSWVFTTQANTPVLQRLRATTVAGTATLAPTGLNLGAIGQQPIADIIIGVMPVRYFLSAPSAANPTAPLNQFWKAAPGAYVAPFNALGLDPTSTNITVANPDPVATATLNIPVLMTVPNAASGREKPAAGWPVVIFQHGITGNRSNMLGIAQTMASQGFAVVAIDQPLHGIRAADGPPFSLLYVENTPFAPIASERTFDVDYVNNTTGAPGPDGNVDGSGQHFINLASLLTSRDNLRQSVSDLFTLAKTIPSMSVDGDAVGDFDGSRISFVGLSLGSIVGLNFVAIDSSVTTSVLSVPGGGIAQLLNNSATFGPVIRAGLAGNGVVAGTPAFDQFLGAAQQCVDAGDPINYAPLAAGERILLHEVVGTSAATSDQVIPNFALTAPLAGTEPLIRALGLPAITASVQSAGVRGAVRFTAGEHASLIRPTVSPAATAEMQGQMASMIVSNGQAVQVTNTSVIRTQ